MFHVEHAITRQGRDGPTRLRKDRSAAAARTHKPSIRSHADVMNPARLSHVSEELEDYPTR